MGTGHLAAFHDHADLSHGIGRSHAVIDSVIEGFSQRSENVENGSLLQSLAGPCGYELLDVASRHFIKASCPQGRVEVSLTYLAVIGRCGWLAITRHIRFCQVEVYSFTVGITSLV